MELQVKGRIREISPYVGGMSNFKGRKMVKMSSNENALGCSPLVVDVVKNIDSYSLYPCSIAYSLRRSISQVSGLPFDNIICGAGSDEILSLLCSVYAGPGNDVLYSEYGFLMYPISALKVGANPIKAKEDNYKTSVDNILSAVTEKTSIVFIANPNNPTGSYISYSELKRLRESLRQDILLVIDCAYAEFVDESDYETGERLVKEFNNVVITRTFSKIYGLAGLRLGWAYANQEIIEMLNRARGPFNVSNIAQIAGVKAFEDIDFVYQSQEYNKEQYGYLTQQLKRLGIKYLDSVCNFILLEFNNSETASEFYQHSLENGFILRSMEGYYLHNFVRMTIGKQEDNVLFIESCEKFVKK